MSMGGSCWMRTTSRWKGPTYLSHLSLLFRHGSQFMAFRARLVGGRLSACWSAADGDGETGRPLTTPAVRCGFGRCSDGDTGWSSGIVRAGNKKHWDIRRRTFCLKKDVGGASQSGQVSHFLERYSCIKSLFCKSSVPKHVRRTSIILKSKDAAHRRRQQHSRTKETRHLLPRTTTKLSTSLPRRSPSTRPTTFSTRTEAPQKLARRTGLVPSSMPKRCVYASLGCLISPVPVHQSQSKVGQGVCSQGGRTTWLA